MRTADKFKLARDWPEGTRVLVMGDHPHNGATGRVRHPKAKSGAPRGDFPGMVLVDLDEPRGPIVNVYAKPKNLRRLRRR